MTAPENQKPEREAIEFDLGSNGGMVLWRSLQEANDWIDTEISSFEWTDTTASEASNHVKENVVRKLNSLKNEVKRYFNNEINSNPCTEALREMYRTNRVPHSSTPLANTLREWSEEDKPGATTGLACLINIPHIRSFSGHQFQSAVKATLLKMGQGVTETAGSEALRRVAETWDREFHQRRIEVDEAVRVAYRVETQVQSKYAEFEQFQSSTQNDIQKLKETFDSELKSIKKKYEHELALREPVNYWKIRANHHKESANRWATASIGLLSLIFVWILFVSLCFESPTSKVSELINEGSIDADAATSIAALAWIESLAVFGSVMFLLIWPLRIFIRNYLSHSHLQADASERSVLIETYLALLNDPEVQSVGDLKDRMLPPLLANIFRHTADGIVKDDAWPWQTLVDALKSK